MLTRQIGNATLILADCADALPTLSNIDAVVCDPPYGLSFMGKAWDYDVPQAKLWTMVNETMKPGAHLLSFFGSRTYHRGAVQIEDAGFDIRDQIMWIYGSGFPKSLDVSKAIDKAAGATRKVTAERVTGWSGTLGGKVALSGLGDAIDIRRTTAPATPEAHQWEGWGTALKPAHEPIVVARKPFRGTVAANVMQHGTGALNIDACRVAGGKRSPGFSDSFGVIERSGSIFGEKTPRANVDETQGRFPANIIHDGSEEVLAGFPNTSRSRGGRIGNAGGGNVANVPTGTFAAGDPGYGDEGSAARFFYCAKASKKDRGDNAHPTVKPTALMRYLCRLVTPAGGVVLDPFMGSGSTGKAAILEGFRFIGIERDPEYFEIACKRLSDLRMLQIP